MKAENSLNSTIERELTLRNCAILTSLAITVFYGNAIAQTAERELPQGRAVSGWAIEVIPGDDRRPIEEFAGVRGYGRLSRPSSLISFEQTAQQVGAGTPTIHNGRAFLKINVEGDSSFAIQIRRTGGMIVSCDGVLSVGGTRVLAGRVIPRDGFMTIAGNARLTPGYYRVEYTTRCNRYNKNESEYNIVYRGPSDNTPRLFRADELFHLQQ
ncbi:MAG: hypothetical protein ABIL01_02270 [Pseudomonadota bacterium]